MVAMPPLVGAGRRVVKARMPTLDLVGQEGGAIAGGPILVDQRRGALGCQPANLGVYHHRDGTSEGPCALFQAMSLSAW